MSTTFIITERSVVAWGYWGGGYEGGNIQDQKETSEGDRLAH